MTGKLNWEQAAARQRANAVPPSEREPVRDYELAARNRERRAQARAKKLAKVKRAAAADQPTIKVVRREDRPAGAHVISSSRKPKRRSV